MSGATAQKTARREFRNPHFLQEVIEGLSRKQKELPCKYFYDERGSKLFDEICELEEYYPTRTELAIMEQHAGEMAALLAPEAALIEFGSGSSTKTRVLLNHARSASVYVPLDISGEHLLATASGLRAEYPELNVEPLCADYTTPFSLPETALAAPQRVVYFPGSTIGNFRPVEAVQFMKGIREVVGVDGGLLIGVDLKKPADILESAYNDAAGVTAEFNLNLLERINRELGADFPLDQFMHRALYNSVAGRIEMHLISRARCKVTIAGKHSFTFRPAETIWTESSHKYSSTEFARLAGQAGFAVERFWSDPQRLFSVQFLRARAAQ